MHCGLITLYALTVTGIGKGDDMRMGLVKAKRLAAMHKQERTKSGLKSCQLKVAQPIQSRHPLLHTYINPVVTPAADCGACHAVRERGPYISSSTIG